jgi:hypothetical protein
VAALKHRNIANQKPFAQTTKHAQEIAAACPNALDRVGMDFANAITIIIARPFALSWRMANGLMGSSTGGEMVIGRPFIGVDDRIITRMAEHEGLQCGSIRVFTHLEADVTTAASDDTDNWGTIALPSSVATRLIGSPARWVERVGVFAAFLTGVLIEFVGFGHWVGEWCGRGKNAPPGASVFRVVVRAGGCD